MARRHRFFADPFRFVSLISLRFTSSAVAVSPPCPCNDESLCRPITGPPANPGGELFGFFNGSWVPDGLPPGHDMNWTYVTTVAWANRDEVMCMAHLHGARAVIGPPPIDLDALAKPPARKAWIRSALDLVQGSHRDGIVFDYEEPQDIGSVAAETYAALIAETRDSFHSANPSLQISTCVAWSPDNIDGRGYPYKKLADASDLLYVMDYDTRSQIYDSRCIAGPNAPYPGMVEGIERYLDLGIGPSKLILGVPWYGYRYECRPGTSADAIVCPIEQVPFRGANCSDAAGREVTYADIRKKLRSTNVHMTGGLRRDSNTGDPFFNTIETNNDGDSIVVQYWFDDPNSLHAKFLWARGQNLAGVGPFIFNNLDPVGARDEASEMWCTFDSFFKTKETEIAALET